MMEALHSWPLAFTIVGLAWAVAFSISSRRYYALGRYEVDAAIAVDNQVEISESNIVRFHA